MAHRRSSQVAASYGADRKQLHNLRAQLDTDLGKIDKALEATAQNREELLNDTIRDSTFDEQVKEELVALKKQITRQKQLINTKMTEKVDRCRFKWEAMQKEATEVDSLIHTHIERISQLHGAQGRRRASRGKQFMTTVLFKLLQNALLFLLYVITIVIVAVRFTRARPLATTVAILSIVSAVVASVWLTWG